MADPIRVAIVDDQPLFASGMRMLIEAQPDLECVGTASDGRESVTLFERVRPDIVLMDLRMPVLNGIEATKLILNGRKPEDSPRVIVLTTIQRDEAVYSALRAGASAFLTKDATPADVLATIRGTHRGQPTATEVAALGLVREFSAAHPGRPGSLHERLSPRECEVMLAVADGCTNSQIAARAQLSEATVKTHVRSVLSKLNLRSRVHIVIYAYEYGLVAGQKQSARRGL
ncbi:response regulator transcription factor [Diaminobutyricibacter tongyongensis]|uniref:Response regulator transcription factor n=1 Tax=Leifsonia tongyongensis TaxID=1268043 RepID=A0A6L9XTV9_9MICO|nr:response regulator transcription factor [Diaminobutyricibacter tongyongensis]NEN04725.1 response regulator transcription factor [Diaminobutyricibacter tongyongensis]